MKRVIFWQNKFFSASDAPVLNPDSGLLRGIGLFETMRAYRGNIIYFKQHIARIRNSCNALGLRFPYDAAKTQKIILGLLKASALSDARVRLTVWEENDKLQTLVTAARYSPPPAAKYREGFSLGVGGLRQDEDSFLARHKTTSRLIYEINFSQAQQNGFDEAIMLNQRGYISEATRGNIFFVKNKTLFTPALACGCLNGITRRVVFDLCAKCALKVYEGKFTLEDLCAAESVFLANSLMGLMPVTRIGKRHSFKSTSSKITRFIIRKYRNLLGRKQ